MISLFEDTLKGGSTVLGQPGTRAKPKQRPFEVEQSTSPLSIAMGAGSLSMYALDPEKRLKYLESLKKEQPSETTYQAPTSILTGTERMRGAKARGKLLGGKKNANY